MSEPSEGSDVNRRSTCIVCYLAEKTIKTISGVRPHASGLLALATFALPYDGRIAGDANERGNETRQPINFAKSR